MKNLKSQILTIIFIIAIISLISPSHCKNVIEKTCKQTPHYDLCVQSLKSDPSSSDADVTGLAVIMVKVTEAKANGTSDKIKQLLGGGDLEPKQEKALKSCSERYEAVIKWDVPQAIGALNGNPKFAEEAMQGAANEAFACESEFSGTTSLLTRENQAFRDLAVVAVAIIKLLL
ncbi:cell wall / vacuolar inhibitor of fructosidase 1-like [Prosopis cineraria]|uniref:cell wall / vacuolar inhibitor of fructosidase 1-like n=1 Tax=Prosopis cineraria TaxID=364024 RepID=UPI00240F6DC1|nr:cell wall / vacuolar inhibitor of fructosidase 1-like [Prosopis cineraria]